MILHIFKIVWPVLAIFVAVGSGSYIICKVVKFFQDLNDKIRDIGYQLDDHSMYKHCADGKQIRAVTQETLYQFGVFLNKRAIKAGQAPQPKYPHQLEAEFSKALRDFYEYQNLSPESTDPPAPPEYYPTDTESDDRNYSEAATPGSLTGSYQGLLP